MSAFDLHDGDIGTALDITIKDKGVVVDVSTATTVSYKFKKPDGTVVTKTGAVQDGPNGVVRYTTISGDINLAGDWELQIYLVLSSPAWNGHSSKLDFNVRGVLA